MTDTSPSRWTGFLRLASTVAFVVALLVFPAAWLLAANAQAVIQVKPLDRAKWGEVDPLKQFELDTAKELGDEVTPQQVGDLYGTVLGEGEPIEVLFAPEDWLITPKEMPEIQLLAVDKDPADPLNANPFQVQSVWFMAPFVFGGALVAGILLFLLRKWLLRRRA